MIKTKESIQADMQEYDKHNESVLEAIKADWTDLENLMKELKTNFDLIIPWNNESHMQIKQSFNGLYSNFSSTSQHSIKPKLPEGE